MDKKSIREMMSNFFTGKDDKMFLVGFRSDWNKFCNYYTANSSDIDPGDGIDKKELFSDQKDKLLKDFGTFYEIYLKNKILPDIKFVVDLDKTFWNTIKDMHDVIGENSYPVNKKIDIDRSYDVRYRGILLIEYLLNLNSQRARYFCRQILKFAIYLLPILITLELVINIVKIFI